MLMTLIKKGTSIGEKEKVPLFGTWILVVPQDLKSLWVTNEVGLLKDRIQQVFFWIWILNWTVGCQRYINQ